MATLGEVLRQARSARSISMREAARELGTESTTYRSWEADFFQPRPDKVDALARFLRISRAEVLGLLGILDADEVEILRSANDRPRNPSPARARRRIPAPATVAEDPGAYLSGPISVPNLGLALVA